MRRHYKKERPQRRQVNGVDHPAEPYEDSGSLRDSQLENNRVTACPFSLPQRVLQHSHQSSCPTLDLSAGGRLLDHRLQGYGTRGHAQGQGQGQRRSGAPRPSLSVDGEALNATESRRSFFTYLSHGASVISEEDPSTVCHSPMREMSPLTGTDPLLSTREVSRQTDNDPFLSPLASPRGSDVRFLHVHAARRLASERDLGVTDEERLMNSNRIHLLQSSLAACLKMSTKEEFVGRLMYDTLMRTLPEPGIIAKRGRTMMSRASNDTVAALVAFVSEPSHMETYMDWLALRHVHYKIDTTLFPQFRQAMLVSLEQVMADQWNAEIERAWSEAYEMTSQALQKKMEKADRRLRLIKEAWEAASQQLGLHAMEAKVAANLMVASLAASKSAGKNTVKMHARQSSLAKGVVKLVFTLVDSVFDLQKLRGVFWNLGTDFQEIFREFGTVPALEKIEGVVLQTMEEVVGAGKWNEDHEDAWKWLWGLATEERVGRWRHKDKEEALAAWAVLERRMLQELRGDEDRKGRGKDFFRDDSSSEVHMEDHPGEKEKVLAMLSDVEAADCLQVEESTKKGKKDKRNQKKTNGLDFLRIHTTEKDKEDKGDGKKISKRSQKSNAEKENGKETGAEDMDLHEQKKHHASKKTLQARLEEGRKVSIEVAEIFTRELFGQLSDLCPTVREVYVKMPSAYVETNRAFLQRLLAYLDDPAALWEDDEELAMRHLTFNIMPSDVPLYCRAVLRTFQKIGGREWTNRHDAIWTKVLNLAGAGLSHVLIAACHPITRALVMGSPNELVNGLRECGRGERADWACAVTISGESRSPVYWMIQAGFSDLALILIKDVLALRCNKSEFFCGRETLWRTHGKTLLPTLTVHAKELVSPLLDGHVWCSDYVVQGKRRVLFYLKELWGDSRLKGEDGDPLFPEQHAAPLTLLTKMNDTTVTAHQAVDHLVNLKWDLYAKRRFLTVQYLSLLQVLSFSCGYVWLVHLPPEIGMFFRAVSWAMSAVAIWIFVSRVVTQRKRGVTRPLLFGVETSFECPFSSGSSWNFMRLVSSGIQLGLSIWDFEAGIEMWSHLKADGYNSDVWTHFGVEYSVGHGHYYHVLLVAVVSILLWLSACELMLVSEDTATMIVGTYMVAGQFFRYMAFVGLVTLGFASALSNVGVETPGFHDFEESCMTLVAEFASAWEPRFSHRDHENHTHPTVMLFVLAYVVVSTLIFANSLMAIIIVTWSEGADRAREKARHTRAELVVEVDSLMSQEALNGYADSLGFDEKRPLDDDRIEGPPGSVEAWVDAESFKVPGVLERGGRISRLEFYDSEANFDVPWQDEDLINRGRADEEQGGGGGRALASFAEEAERDVKNMRAPANKMLRFLKRHQENEKRAEKTGSDIHESSQGSLHFPHL